MPMDASQSGPIALFARAAFLSAPFFPDWPGKQRPRRDGDSGLLAADEESWDAMVTATWIERTIHELAIELQESRG